MQRKDKDYKSIHVLNKIKLNNAQNLVYAENLPYSISIYSCLIENQNKNGKKYKCSNTTNLIYNLQILTEIHDL